MSNLLSSVREDTQPSELPVIGLKLVNVKYDNDQVTIILENNIRLTFKVYSNLVIGKDSIISTNQVTGVIESPTQDDINIQKVQRFDWYTNG